MIGTQNYKQDKYYPKVLSAFDRLLSRKNIIEPVEVFIEMGNLEKAKHDDWRHGRIPSLEKAINGSLSKCSRILKIIGFCAHDFDMLPSQTVYNKNGKGGAAKLQFCKSGNTQIEKSYSKCFRWNKKLSYSEWKARTSQ